MLEVVQAAIRDPEGKVHTLPRPARHSGVYFQMMREGTPYASDEVVKGFLLSDGTFASRRQAGRANASCSGTGIHGGAWNGSSIQVHRSR